MKDIDYYTTVFCAYLFSEMHYINEFLQFLVLLITAIISIQKLISFWNKKYKKDDQQNNLNF